MISLIECEMVIGLIHNLQHELLIKGNELKESVVKAHNIATNLLKENLL